MAYDTPFFNFRPCTHFYFSLPTEKFLRGQREILAWAGRKKYPGKEGKL